MRRRLDQRIKSHHLRALEAIAAQHSLIKAAATLGISQPALTRTLQELEEITAARLFDRLSRGVRPTEAGSLLVRTAQRVLAELRRLEDELDRVADPAAGTVAVGTLPVAANGVLPGALIRLKAERPEVRVRLRQGRTEELLPLLASGEVDLIVGRLYQPAAPDGFTREALWDEPISVLARAGHPLFARPAVTAAELAEYEPVLPTIGQRVGQEIEALVEALGLSASVSLRSSSYGFIREMLHATDMISVMPRLMMAGDLQRGSLRVVPLPVAAPARPAGLILPAPGREPPAAALFVAVLRRHLADLARQGIASMTGGYTSGPISDWTGPVRTE